MSWWDSYRAVYGAELRAAVREYGDHGWSVVEAPDGLHLRTGEVLDVVDLPAARGRAVCARMRDAGLVAPVAATPTGRWLFPVAAGGVHPAELPPEAVLHTGGTTVLVPPSEVPDGWVHWRVPPAAVGYRLPPAAGILRALPATDEHDPIDRHRDEWPGAQRPDAPLAVSARS